MCFVALRLLPSSVGEPDRLVRTAATSLSERFLRMKLTNWLKSRLFRSQKARRLKRVDCRPRLTLETLEGRSLLATFTVALTGNDGNPGGLGGGSYRTIQAAIVAASAASDGNDEIRVAGGVYNTAGVDQRFDIGSSGNLQNLQLLGGWNAAFTTRDPGTTPTNYTFTNSPASNREDIQVFDANTKIDGFTFRSSDGTTPRGADNILVSSTGDTISNNIFYTGNLRVTGFRSSGVVTGGADNSGLQILNNTFNVDFTGVSTTNTAAIGVFLNPSAATTSVLVDGNTFFGNNMNSGIIVSGVKNVTVQNNTINRNTPVFGAGIELRNNIAAVDNAIIVNNTISDVNTSAANVSGGIVLGGSGGVFAAVTNTNIRGNIISMSGPNSAGISALAGAVAASTLIERNAITAPTAGLAASSSVAGLDVSGNWFGSATASGVDAAISASGGGTIVARSYLSSGTDANPAAPGLQLPATTEMLVPQTKATSGLTDVDGKIQSGVDRAVAGMTVRVAADTYTENVIIAKSVELAGAGQLATIVVPSFVGANTGGGSLAAGSSSVILVQAGNVKIHDLTVNGDNPNLMSGISVGGADIDARNGIITNHNAGMFNGLEVYNTTVKNIYLRGIYASSGGTFNFHNDTVRNVQADPASIAMFNFGGSGFFTNNAVSAANDGISSNHSTGTVYDGNIVTNSGSGIHTDNNGSSGGIADEIKNNTVSAGSVPGGSYGIWVFAPYRAVSVHDNSVSDVDAGLSAFGQLAPVTVSFAHNTVDANHRAGSIGAWVSTTLFEFGSADVSASFTADNTITNAETGILVEEEPGYTAKATISGNNISSNGTGILVRNSDVSITENSITSNADGIVIGDNSLDTSSVNANDCNIISGNTNSGLTNNSLNLVNAEENFWGNSTGPTNAGNPGGTGDKVIGTVDFSPWAADPSCTIHVSGSGASLQTDPCDPGMALVIVGTSGDDKIEVKRKGNSGNVEVKINTQTFTFAESAFIRIIVYGLAGNDDIQVQEKIAAPAWLFGDAGNDHLKAGDRDSVLVGGDGDDHLEAGNGRDLLIGGDGKDHLQGKGDDDILIAGIYDDDHNLAALCAIMDAWTSDDNGDQAAYNTRRASLTGLLNTTTVHDDGDEDKLEGNAGLDWFFANITGSGVKDKVSGVKTGEVVTDIN